MSNPQTPQALSTRLKNQLADYVTNEIERGIRRNFDAISDPAGFIASTDPAPANLSFSREMVRRVCRSWARGGTPIQGALADLTYGPLCTPYLDGLNEAPLNGSVGAPFVGGQCVGKPYIVYWEFTASTGQKGSGAPGFRYGPISREINSTGTNSWQILLKFFDVNGVPQTTVLGNRFGEPIAPIWTRFDIVPNSGFGPDNCGNPSPVYQPPRTVPGLPSLTGQPVNFPGFGDIPVTVSFDNDGNIIVDLPTLGVNVSVPNPLAGNDQGEGIPPGGQGTVGTPVDSADGEAAGEDPTRNLVGVKVDLLNIPPRANAQFNQQSVYYKGAYYVYMGGEAGMSQHPAAIVKTSQFYYADKGANKWRIEANQGYTLRATPYYED